MGIDVIVTRAGLEYSATKTSTNVSWTKIFATMGFASTFKAPTIAFADLDSLETIAQKNSTNVWPDHVKTMERVLTWSMATDAPVLRDTKVGFYKY